MTRGSLLPDRVDHIALIGNFLPRKCGLATFTTDCFEAMRARFPEMRVDVYAMDDRPGSYDFPPAVTATIPQDDRVAYLDAARAIDASGAQAIWVQHEYGIYGGPAGEHLIALLDRSGLPVIATLHTVLEAPNPDERRVMEALLRRAARVIVMAEKGRDILRRAHGVDPRKVVVVPHGVPDRALVDPDTIKPRFGWQGRQVILTFGLLAPSKGIETVIEALPAIVAGHPDALYVILGATHPNLVAHEGEAYRDRLHALAATLGVQRNIAFVNAFVEQDELLDYLQAADIYATPYLNPVQITSGTLSYAVASGKPVVSTPYVHATEILANNHGVLVPFGDSGAFADAISALLDDDKARVAMARRAHDRGRTMIWPRIAEAVADLLDAVRDTRPPRIRAHPSARTTVLPGDFRAVERMSDSTGMLQHSIYAVPDRRHGYCIDDNARALILMHRIDPLDESARDRWTSVFAAFVQYAWNPDLRRFRNFMSFDRQWCEDKGSEDSNGRALWSLGVSAAEARAPKYRDWARILFDQTASIALEFDSPRARAFAMLGAAAMLDAHPGHALSRALLERFGDELIALLDIARRPQWEWFEIVLAYDNARLPEALIRAGEALGRPEFTACGLSTLAWIVEQQTSPDGRFRAVGSESFGRPYAAPLPFDQQPLEAQATIDACAAAFDATGDTHWVECAHRAYRWYLGQNDLDLPLASTSDGGCFDGLTPYGLNRNQGAESILALQLAGCAISALSRRAQIVADPGKAVA
ncbi:glycosyltransferase family 4 protein [Sphingomonas sp.]|uniref:glycosyltransferase family 4 protein n=1 Tax=Sphingomonas sp. TaxID=28214 RepID=UPI002E14E981|nr:glycosyltransferase family 4 protein [Sphingomonas sp.]